jgi:hypothetical protein
MRIKGETTMKFLAGILFASLFTFAANAQDSPFRKELKRADLTGTNMEVVTSISEIKPGDTSTLHIHHGEKSFYVLEGGTIELPDGKTSTLCDRHCCRKRAGCSPGAFKVVGDKTVKLLTVHIVDKGKPLYDKPSSK